MTKQDILDYFKDINAMYNECTRYDDLSRMIDELQEPCTDAISREDALMALTGEYTDSPIEILPKAIKRINKLPPVTPAEKVGHWIKIDDCSNSGYYCSECHKRVVKEGWSDTVKKIKYCPNCGSRMMQEVTDEID